MIVTKIYKTPFAKKPKTIINVRVLVDFTHKNLRQ